MPQQELLKLVVLCLDAAGIDYMLTGSLASSLLGEPRSTHDIDLVVEFEERHAEALLRAFPPPDFYLSRESMLSAIKTKSMFNLMSTKDGEKVDFWILTDQPFDQTRFRRKLSKSVGDLSFWVSTPEDTILMKLRWAKDSGGSEKQFTDALRVYEVQRGVLDLQYLNHWASVIDIYDLWKKLQADAHPL